MRLLRSPNLYVFTAGWSVGEVWHLAGMVDRHGHINTGMLSQGLVQHGLRWGGWRVGRIHSDFVLTPPDTTRRPDCACLRGSVERAAVRFSVTMRILHFGPRSHPAGLALPRQGGLQKDSHPLPESWDRRSPSELLKRTCLRLSARRPQ